MAVGTLNNFPNLILNITNFSISPLQPVFMMQNIQMDRGNPTAFSLLFHSEKCHTAEVKGYLFSFMSISNVRHQKEP